MAEWETSLNEQQRQAATAVDGPVLIVAGPGTGKTKTLTARIAHLVASKRAEPGQILALTFTKKAAEEMRARVGGLLRGPASSDFPQRARKLRAPGVPPDESPLGEPKICTFHALCQELLDSETPFATDVERLQIIKGLSRPASLKGLSARELGLAISRAKNQVDADDPDVAKVVRSYNKALEARGLRDFDDLLCDAYELLKTDEAKRAEVRKSYAYVLVDEFQDTNKLQYELLKLMLGNDNLFVIGDPNQSIYGFRGASGTIFDEFRQDFPKHVAVTLTTNYRSVPQVVQLANAIFIDDENLEAHTEAPGSARAVEVLNEYGEAEWVLGEIQRAIGGGDLLKAVSDDLRSQHRRLSDFAVLYRSRPAAATFQKMLAESGLPYQVVGDGSPYDQPHIQAILALLRSAAKGEPVELEGYGSAQRKLLAEELAKVPDAMPHALADRLLAILGIEPSRDTQQLLSVLVRFKKVPEALAYFDDIAERGFYDPSADAITLLTIHASKGLEFPHVFLLGAEEGILPSSRGDEAEERRLLYVAITRAREALDVLHAKNRGGEKAETSRFLADLSKDVLPRHADPNIASQMRRIAKRSAKNSQTSLF
jgi:superfamily I DNA/RNA helicase